LASDAKQKIYATTLDSTGTWSEPVIASFSTDTDESPFISPDGKYFFFASCRPMDGHSLPLPMDMNIWVMTKTDTGWSEARPLPGQINKKISSSSKWPENYETSPTIDIYGHLYFWTKSSISDASNIYSTSFTTDGIFTHPRELVPPASHRCFDSAPVISGDGTLLLFSSEGRADNYGQGDIYYSKKIEGEWSEPKNLGPDINTEASESFPRFSADGKYFFFSSDRGDNVDADGEKIWSIYYMESKYLLIN
jgi:Tol biopolymer transport system component